jgi:hypothetical protein
MFSEMEKNLARQSAAAPGLPAGSLPVPLFGACQITSHEKLSRKSAGRNSRSGRRILIGGSSRCLPALEPAHAIEPGFICGAFACAGTGNLKSQKAAPHQLSFATQTIGLSPQ